MRLSTILIAAGLTTANLVAAQNIAAPPTAIDHVALYVRDVGRTVSFYQGLFGLPEVPSPVPFARWLVLRGGTMLHIVGGRKSPVANERWDHIALTCPDMPAFIARVEARGIPWSDLQGRAQVQSGIRGRKIRQIFIQDPDGYWIEVNDVSPTPGADRPE